MSIKEKFSNVRLRKDLNNCKKYYVIIFLQYINYINV